MLKRIKPKTRPRIFKSAMSKSRWKPNFCMAIAAFLLLLSVSLLHSRLGAEGTHDSRIEENSRQASDFDKFSVSRKELVDKEDSYSRRDRVLDEGGSAENLESLERRENLGVSEGEDEEDEEEEEEEETEMEDFDGFQDKIDDLDEMEEVQGERGEGGEGREDNFSEGSLNGGERNDRFLENQDVGNGENGVKGTGGEEASGRKSSDDNGFSGKSLERLGQFRTIPRWNSTEEQKRTKGNVEAKGMGSEKIKLFRGRAGLFWDHVMGVTRKAFMKHPQRHLATGDQQIVHDQESDIDLESNGGWEDAIGENSVAGSNDRIKQAFSSDDEPIDDSIRNGLEEVYAIEDALLLKSSGRMSPLRSGWGPWFDTIQRRASKSDFIRRDRMAKSTVDLLNPLNNPLLQDPDAIGPYVLTKSDRVIQKALKKASIEGVPFVGEHSFHREEVTVEETSVDEKEQMQDEGALQKSQEESNLDGGEEASLKERNNSDNEDDASVKTELTQLTRKALDESDNNITHLESKVGNKDSVVLIKTLRGNEQMPEQVIKREAQSHEDLRDNIKNYERSRKDARKSNTRRKKAPLKEQVSKTKEDTIRRLHSLSALEVQKYKLQDSSEITPTLANKLGVHSIIMDNNVSSTSRDNRVISNKSVHEGMEKMGKKIRGVGDTVKNKSGKTTGVENIEKIQRPGETAKLSSASQKTLHRRTRRNRNTRRWGYFPGLDPLLSFSDFMDAFLQDGNCSLRVFMAWTTPPWTYTVRYQRGLESLLYFHPHACVVVFSDSIELDFFSDFAKDGYRVAVVMPNLDELLHKTPAHIFASVWLDWRNVDLYFIHYTELLRLAALYKYGGVYLDSDIVVLKAIDSLNNTIGTESPPDKEFTLNGAVMAFEKDSSYLLECLREFTATYDDTLLRWNGAELLTRVAKRSIQQNGEIFMPNAIKLQPYWAFYPLRSYNITRFFTAPSNQNDEEMQKVLINRILNESFALHFWNSVTSKIVPESGSLVERILNYHCLHCTDLL